MHSNGTLPLPLMLTLPLDARCVHSLSLQDLIGKLCYRMTNFHINYKCVGRTYRLPFYGQSVILMPAKYDKILNINWVLRVCDLQFV